MRSSCSAIVILTIPNTLENEKYAPRKFLEAGNMHSLPRSSVINGFLRDQTVKTQSQHPTKEIVSMHLCRLITQSTSLMGKKEVLQGKRS